jgi:lipopolysaccharide assembly protein A
LFRFSAATSFLFGEITHVRQVSVSQTRSIPMRPVYIGLITVVTAVVLVFTFQNLDNVTVSFLAMSIALPVSVLVILIYVLGMFTGSMVQSLLRSWIKGAAKGGEEQ